MAIIKVYDDTKNPSTCRSCDAPVWWVEHVVTGKRGIYDSEPVYVRTEHLAGRLVGEIDTSITVSHFSTCPESQQWRKK